MKFRLSNLLTATNNPFATAKSSEHRANRLWFRLASLAIKLGVSGAALVYIYFQVAQSSTQALALLSMQSVFSARFVLWFLLPSLVLMCLNWGIEVVKWHMLIAPRYGTHWRTSVKAILSGTTFGVFSSNRVGEFLGRILALQPQHRIGASVLSLVNGAAQSLATFTFGAFGLLYLLEVFGTQSMGLVGCRVLQLIVVISWVAAIAGFLRIGAFGAFLSSIPWLERFRQPIEEISRIERPLLFRLYHFSLLRFVTFILQYLVVFNMLMPDPAWAQVTGASTLALFSTTILSFIPIPDLLLREAVALSYFDLFQFDPFVVGEAVFAVWLINVALPAVSGAIILFTYRIFRP